MHFLLLLSLFFSASNPPARLSGDCDPTEITIQVTTVKAMTAYENIIRVKLDTVIDDSIKLSVIESSKGNLRPSTSFTVPKHLLEGRLHLPTFITIENEFDTLGSTLLPRRRVVLPKSVENFIDTFIIVGASKASRGYNLGHVYAFSDSKGYVNTPHNREYGVGYQELEHLGDSKVLQQMIKAVVAHIDSSRAGINSIGANYEQYTNAFLSKFKPENAVNSALRIYGLEDLLMFDLNHIFGDLTLKDKIEMSAYSEQIIHEFTPKASGYYHTRITGMRINSTEDLETAVKSFAKLAPKTRTFGQVKQLIASAVLHDKSLTIRKRTIRRLIRVMSRATDGGDDVYFREELAKLLR